MGISQSLISTFNNATSTSTTTPPRFLKVTIQAEQADLAVSVDARGSDKDDFDLIGEKADLTTTEPAYILYRLDSKSTSGVYEWILLCYVPDTSKARDKMIYSSSKGRLTKALGEAFFTDSIFATTKSDLTPAAYAQHLRIRSGPPPLTEREKDMLSVREGEAEAARERGEVHAAMQGTGGRGGPMSLAMAMSGSLKFAEGVKEAVEGLKGEGGRGKVVGLVFDASNTLTVSTQTTSTIADIHTLFPTTTQYTFFAYEPEKILLFFTVGNKSPIRSRMIYSSSLGSLVTSVKDNFGVTVLKKIESSEPATLTEPEILSHLPSTTAPSQAGFSRPSRPGGGGAARGVPRAKVTRDTWVKAPEAEEESEPVKKVSEEEKKEEEEKKGKGEVEW